MSHILCEWLMTKYGQTGYQRRGFIMPEKENFMNGEVVECTVKNVMICGLLVSFGPMRGMIHKTEIPSGTTEGYSPGDKITAKIISINTATGHTALSVRQLADKQPPTPEHQPQPIAQQPEQELTTQPTTPQPNLEPQPQPTTPQLKPEAENQHTPQQDSNLASSECHSLLAETASHTIHDSVVDPPAPKSPAMSDDEFLNLCQSADHKQITAALSNGANVNAADSKGHTALMTAAMKNTHPEVIELLINSGADVHAQTKKGVTVLVYAEANKHLRNTKAMELIRSPSGQQAKKSVMTPEKFMNLCVAGTPAQIATAIKTGVNINAPHTHGITPLMAAARANDPTAVNVLLNAGASIKPKDQAGRTALDWAKTNPKLQGSKILKHL